MLAVLRQLLAPPMFEDDEATRTAGLLNVILLASLAVTTAYSLTLPFISPRPGPLLVSYAILIGLELSAFILMRRGRVRSASTLFVVAGWLVVTVGTFAFGGIRSSSYSAYMILILVAGLLLGARAGLIAAGLGILVGVAALYAELNGLLPAPQIPLTPLFSGIGLALNFTVTAVLLLLATRNINDVLAQSRRHERELAERNRELQDSRAMLEARARQQAAVARLGQQALARLDVSTLIAEAASLVAEILNVEFSKVLELVPDAGRLRLRGGVGWTEGLVGEMVMSVEADSQAAFTLRSEAPVIVEDLETETRFRGPSLLHSHGVVSGLSVIISGQDRPFGILGAHTARRRTFTTDDVNFLQGVANVLAQAIVRHRAEEESHQSELRFRNLFENSPDAIFVEDLDGNVLDANPAACRLHGLERQALVGMNVLDLVPPDRREEVSRDYPKLSRGEWDKVEGFSWTADGRSVPVEIRASRIDYGSVPALLLHVRDITERRQAEEALRHSEERFRQVIASISDHIYTTEIAADGRFVNRYLSPNLEEFTGYPLERVMADWNFWGSAIIHPEDREAAAAQASRLAQNQASEVEYRLVRKDGRIVWVRDSARVEAAGGTRTVYGIVSDITERKRLEDQVRQSQKMEAIGRLAGGVAHDFNNLLTVMTGYCGLVLTSVDPADPVARDVDQIRRAANQASALTRQLLAFSRQQVLKPQVLNLNHVLADMDQMLRRLIGEDVEMVSSPDPALGAVKADRGQIEQVVMNLAANARDAMPQGGRLTIETMNVDLGENYAHEHVDVKPGRYVLLAVSDTGQGIDEEVRAHIFEPFYTTKVQGHGTGLGLATVHGIVSQSGGHIWVYSERGRGTSFKIYLPLVEEAIAPVVPDRPPVEPLHGTESILLVEDEDLVRQMARRILTQYGYTVLEAADGQAALRIGRQHPGPIHLLLTDVVMPGGMSGRALAERLAETRPEMKVLYMSGYTDNAIVHHGALNPETHFIQKPFSPDGLLRQIRAVLRAAAAE